jgi:hypothetical protein
MSYIVSLYTCLYDKFKMLKNGLWFASPSLLSYPGIQPSSACLAVCSFRWIVVAESTVLICSNKGGVEFSPIAARVRNSGEAGDRFHLNFSVHACAVVLQDFSFSFV